MATNTYTVVKGDTLSGIAEKHKSEHGFSSTYAYVQELVKLNNIKDPDYIVVDQVIKLSGTADEVKPNTTSKATISVFGLQSNTDRTVYATWSWDKPNTEEYQVIWYYDTGDSVWFVGSDSKVKIAQSTYDAPSNANRVKFKVKPISTTYKFNGIDAVYWVAAWSTEEIYSFSSNPPKKPPVPKVNIKNYKLTAELNNLDVNGTGIQFQIVKDDTSVFNTGTANIKTSHASYSCTVAAGSEYKVRCRSVRDDLYSEWSEYSSNVGTIPSIPSGITVCRASSDTSVYLEWSEVKNAESYDLEYSTNKNYFDVSDQVSSVNGIKYTRYEKTGLTAGEEYFFRVRAVNDNGRSGWSPIKSTVIGKNPSAPTTWSSTTTAITGDPLILYWVHNSEDNSSQTYAELELYVNGVKETYTIKNSEEDDKKDKTSSYSIDTSSYAEGVKIQWRVRTAGITKVYGDWSIQRTIDIYAPPTLELSVTDSSGEVLETLESFPFYVTALAGPNTQVPIGYHLSIISNETYETVDILGNAKTVNAGESVYSKYFDITDQLVVKLSAGDVSLDNNISYKIVCLVSMNSGLTVEASSEFVVAWTDIQYEPNAEIAIDKETYSAYIRPHCENENGVPIDDILLSVYRREFDGKFTEIASGIENVKDTYITDPHPALDYARYRIVATSKITGSVSYYDVPGYPIGGKSIIIQWEEDWSSFSSSSEDEMEKPAWSGSMLKLPYNIDVSDSYSHDVELVEYIGRNHPVSYYGTQLGETSSWNAVIEKSDKETLYALRRLSKWSGDVYVREPSGSGYWANVKVSFNQRHLNMTIPVSLSVTRVEGGI